MNKREIGSLAFKLAGIYALILATSLIHSIFYVIGLFQGTSPYSEPTIYARVALAIGLPLPFLLLVALGVFLIVKSDKLSGRMFGESIERMEPSPSGREIQAIAFSVLGIFMFALALPKGMQVIINIFYKLDDPSLRKQIRIGTWATAAGMTAQMILGIFLFFGGRALSRFWHNLRTARQPLPDSVTHEEGTKS